MKNPYFTVGQIVKPQGIHGEVKVRCLSDDPERFHALTEVMLGGDIGPDQKAKVTGCRVSGDSVYLRLEGTNDRNQAEALRGKYLWIDRKQAVPLAQDTYFISDLIDCAVEDETGCVYGRIAEIIQTGSNDVYVVRTTDGRDMLIPALKTIVSRVDIDGSRIVVLAEAVAPYASV